MSKENHPVGKYVMFLNEAYVQQVKVKDVCQEGHVRYIQYDSLEGKIQYIARYLMRLALVHHMPK